MREKFPSLTERSVFSRLQLIDEAHPLWTLISIKNTLIGTPRRMIDQVSAPVKLTHKINTALIASIRLGDNCHGQQIDSNLQQDLDRIATSDFPWIYVSQILNGTKNKKLSTVHPIFKSGWVPIHRMCYLCDGGVWATAKNSWSIPMAKR